MTCPVCMESFDAFTPYRTRAGAQCPGCGSLERHRGLWLVLQRATPLADGGQRVLHFAPEDGLRARIAAVPDLEYVTADLEPGKAMEQLDITAIAKPDASFDAVICVHVLEHVPDDRAAMRELRRVIAPGGWAAIMVPIMFDVTDETEISDPAERNRRYGLEDHIRGYGWDFYDRLAAAGFDVQRIDLRDLVTADERVRFGLATSAPGYDAEDLRLWDYAVSRPA